MVQNNNRWLFPRPSASAPGVRRSRVHTLSLWTHWTCSPGFAVPLLTPWLYRLFTAKCQFRDMPAVLHQHHDLELVLVALLLCATGSLTTVMLMARARQAPDRLRIIWVSAAAIVFGSSVWATHFVAMLAMDVGLPVAYDIVLTALSAAISIGLALVGLQAAIAWGQRWLGGALMGMGVGGMHYMGMAGLRGPFTLNWNEGLIALSLLIGMACAAMALQAETKVSPNKAPALAALLLTLSVCGLHYMGMGAVRFVSNPVAPLPGHMFPAGALAVAVAACAILIVFVGLTSVYVDRYLELRRSDESTRLRAYIAELEETKLKLGVALELAQDASKSKSAFLAAMSHELRTPLNAIIGFSELMVGEAFGPMGDARYRSYCDDIRASGSHLLSLINDILDISRLEARRLELIEAEIALPPLLDETRAMVENHARSAGVTLRFDVLPDLPWLRGDDRRIKQILLNLLSNAIKFTPAGGQVTLTASLKAGGIEISVEDTGIGIGEQDLPKAFESFGQIDNRLGRKYEGSGLGLPLARHLAELHGGTLTLESEVDHGTRARLRFPPERTTPDRALARAGLSAA